MRDKVNYEEFQRQKHVSQSEKENKESSTESDKNNDTAKGCGCLILVILVIVVIIIIGKTYDKEPFSEDGACVAAHKALNDKYDMQLNEAGCWKTETTELFPNQILVFGERFGRSYKAIVIYSHEDEKWRVDSMTAN